MGASQSTYELDYFQLKEALSNDRLISPELLLGELNGRIDDNDFLGKSMTALNSIQAFEEPQSRKEDAIDFENISALLEPGYSNLEHGYVRRDDGTLYIAVLTDLSTDINGDMIDWWFCQCDNDDKYRWWHPKSHMSCACDAPFYAAMPWERPPNYYIDHFNIAEEFVNNQRFRVRYEYLRPNKFVDVSSFEEQGITACIIARLHSEHPKLGSIAIGYMVHVVREVDGRSEMRSRYWLGDIFFAETPDNYYVAQMMDYVSNTWISRSVRLPLSLANSLWRQVVEKMHCLKSFLPAFHERALGDQEVFRKNFTFN